MNKRIKNFKLIIIIVLVIAFLVRFFTLPGGDGISCCDISERARFIKDVLHILLYVIPLYFVLKGIYIFTKNKKSKNELFKNIGIALLAFIIIFIINILFPIVNSIVNGYDQPLNCWSNCEVE